MAAIRYTFIANEVARRATERRRVLEVGCGGQPYRSDVRGTYVGLDLPTSDHLAGASLQIAASAERIPCRDASFDLVFGVAVFHIIDDIESALAECRRVLKADGELLIFDYQRHVCEGLAARGAARHEWDPAALKALLTAAGFSSIKDVSSVADLDESPSAFRLAVRRLRRLSGRRGSWLVMSARP